MCVCVVWIKKGYRIIDIGVLPLCFEDLLSSLRIWPHSVLLDWIDLPSSQPNKDKCHHSPLHEGQQSLLRTIYEC